jgi:hypothetical protein
MVDVGYLAWQVNLLNGRRFTRFGKGNETSRSIFRVVLQWICQGVFGGEIWLARSARYASQKKKKKTQPRLCTFLMIYSANVHFHLKSIQMINLRDFQMSRSCDKSCRKLLIASAVPIVDGKCCQLWITETCEFGTALKITEWKCGIHRNPESGNMDEGRNERYLPIIERDSSE